MLFFIGLSIYFLLLLWMALGFIAHKKYLFSNNNLETNVSIIVCARNEALNIKKCLTSIINQKYNKAHYEILLVNDASTDNTLKIAEEILKNSNCNYQIISNESHIGKKKSIVKAIECAKFNLIVTRDADTFTNSENWLHVLVNFYIDSKSEFIICPVLIMPQNNLLNALQETESFVLNIFTMASVFHKTPFLCSGANLAFTKNLFKETGAYTNHLKIESGDDVFFLEDVKKTRPNTITYLKNKNAVVFTLPQNKFKALVQQKARWAGKLRHSKNPLNWLVALVIIGVNAFFVSCILSVIFSPKQWFFPLIFIISKLLIDILLVFLASRFIKLKTSLFLTILAAMFYPIYALIVAVSLLFMKPNWKLE